MEKEIIKAAPIKPYSIGELRLLYGVSLYVIHKWLNAHETEIGPLVGRSFNLNQVGLIFRKFGTPEKLSFANHGR